MGVKEPRALSQHYHCHAANVDDESPPGTELRPSLGRSCHFSNATLTVPWNSDLHSDMFLC